MLILFFNLNKKGYGWRERFSSKDADFRLFLEEDILYRDDKTLYIAHPEFNVWEAEIRAHGKDNINAKRMLELREMTDNERELVYWYYYDKTKSLKESLFEVYIWVLGKLRAELRTNRLLSYRSKLLSKELTQFLANMAYRSRIFHKIELLECFYELEKFSLFSKPIIWKMIWVFKNFSFGVDLDRLKSVLLHVDDLKVDKAMTLEDKYSFKVLDFYLNNCYSSVFVRLHERSKVRFFSHATKLELMWTGFPIVIVLLILLPSFFLMYGMDEDVDALLTIKVVGHQWYWTYTYEVPFFIQGVLETMNNNLVFSKITFDSYMLDDLLDGSPRLLATDKILVLPKTVHINCLVTASDVLHSWSVPSLGVKVDAIPGRINRADIFIEHEGMFFGMCSELCGVNHAFMPVQVEAVRYSEFLEKLLKSLS